MLVIGTPQPVVTLADYADALTVEDDRANTLVYLIANNSAICRLRPSRPVGVADEPYGPEVLLPPQTNVIKNVAGAKFRSSVAASPASIIAQLLQPDDPQLSGGIPFGQTLLASGGIGSVGIIDRVINPVDIVGVSTEQTLYNFNFTAGQIAASGIVEGRWGGDYLHNNVAADTVRFRIYFGPTAGALTAIYDVTDSLGSNAPAISAARHTWDLYFRLQNKGAINSQQWHGQLDIESVLAGSPTVGLGTPVQAGGSWQGKGGIPIGLGPGAYVFDTSQAMTLRLTAQWSAASGNNSFAMRNGYLQNN